MTQSTLFGPQFDAIEKELGAFVTLDREDESAPSVDGALAGLTVGVKDIIDVANLPTRNGSDTCTAAGPAERDAKAVALLRAEGARILGKTTTTEFAFTDPTKCRNPYDLRRTPGGSSSGSGAAVAAGMVDFALGTQTAGSLCRPAAYCGVVGFKPTYGLLLLDGVTPLAPSFDTLGIIARSVTTVSAVYSVLDTEGAPLEEGAGKSACLLLPTDQKSSDDTAAAFEDARIALEQITGPVPLATLDMNVDAVVEAHRIVMLSEAFQAHGRFLTKGHAHRLRPKFRAALEAASKLSPQQIRDARKCLSEAKTQFWAQFSDFHTILTLPVPEGAPLIDGTTGFQDWLTPWTVFGGPLISLPWGIDGLGRPRAVMLAGPPATDLRVLRAAGKLAERAPSMPRPGLFLS